MCVPPPICYRPNVITRKHGAHGGNLELRSLPAPEASHHLEHDGFALVEGALSPPEVASLRAELTDLFASTRPEIRAPGRTEADYADYRYAALNRSPQAQAAVSHRAILDVIEPLLGEDCHAIANTAWRNPTQPAGAPFGGGGPWHIDAGPHVPRAEGVPWDERIPYPIFAIGCHILLQDCNAESGPTGFVPRSHTSGRVPPQPDENGMLSFEGRAPEVPIGKAGDAVFFVSDVWHRRMPSGPGDQGRFFLQVHYGRRDIAQRLHLTNGSNHHLSSEAIRRAETHRQRTVIGLHAPFFYDG